MKYTKNYVDFVNESKDNKFINEAKGFYSIGTKEVSKDELLSYMYDNPKKPVAKASTGGYPKWMSMINDPKGNLFDWSTIKKSVKEFEKQYGKGNVVVAGRIRLGNPYIEIYTESKSESLSEAKMDYKKFNKEVQDIPFRDWEIVWGEGATDGYYNVAAEYKGKYYLHYGGIVGSQEDLEDVDFDMDGEYLTKQEFNKLKF